MNAFMRTVISGCVLLLAANASFAQTDNGDGDGLVKIKGKKVDQAYLLPGADFAGYKKVIIAPSTVAFQKNWLRDMNNQTMSISRRIADADAKKILDTARSGFDAIWAEAFKKAGYEVVTSAGDDVLLLVPGVVDLYINAPDVMSAEVTRSYTVETGEAKLLLEARDSISGALLGRVVDKRTAGSNMNQLQVSNRVTNRADFEQLFRTWAKIAADGLGDLAQASPLPETLQPNKKLPKKK